MFQVANIFIVKGVVLYMINDQCSPCRDDAAGLARSSRQTGNCQQRNIYWPKMKKFEVEISVLHFKICFFLFEYKPTSWPKRSSSKRSEQAASRYCDRQG